MCAAGALPWVRGLVLFPAQMLGAMCAAGVISCIIPGPISSVETTLAAGMTSAQGVFFEMFLTCELVFTVLMLAAEKSKDTFMAPIGIGLALFVAEIAGMSDPWNSQSLAQLLTLLFRCILYRCLLEPGP